jgi:hypothetical protein
MFDDCQGQAEWVTIERNGDVNPIPMDCGFHAPNPYPSACGPQYGMDCSDAPAARRCGTVRIAESEQASCECYRVITGKYDRLFETG